MILLFFLYILETKDHTSVLYIIYHEAPFLRSQILHHVKVRLKPWYAC